MNGKELLEDIRDRYMDYEYDFNLKKKDIDWLIEQAERVYGTKHKYGLKDMYRICNQDYAELNFINKRYREALEKILNHESSKNIDGGQWDLDSRGRIAEKALEGEAK